MKRELEEPSFILFKKKYIELGGDTIAKNQIGLLLDLIKISDDRTPSFSLRKSDEKYVHKFNNLKIYISSIFGSAIKRKITDDFIYLLKNFLTLRFKNTKVDVEIICNEIIIGLKEKRKTKKISVDQINFADMYIRQQKSRNYIVITPIPLELLGKTVQNNDTKKLLFLLASNLISLFLNPTKRSFTFIFPFLQISKQFYFQLVQNLKNEILIESIQDPQLISRINDRIKEKLSEIGRKNEIIPDNDFSTWENQFKEDLIEFAKTESKKLNFSLSKNSPDEKIRIMDYFASYILIFLNEWDILVVKTPKNLMIYGHYLLCDIETNQFQCYELKGIDNDGLIINTIKAKKLKDLNGSSFDLINQALNSEYSINKYDDLKPSTPLLPIIPNENSPHQKFLPNK